MGAKPMGISLSAPLGEKKRNFYEELDGKNGRERGRETFWWDSIFGVWAFLRMNVNVRVRPFVVELFTTCMPVVKVRPTHTRMRVYANEKKKSVHFIWLDQKTFLAFFLSDI